MITDYIPHAMVASFASVVAYVFREHKRQDDARFGRITEVLDKLEQGQTDLARSIADNHAEVLKLFISKER